jgi:hypothetical protein
MCISVDLPDPDGPITAVNSPTGTYIETPARYRLPQRGGPHARRHRAAEALFPGMCALQPEQIVDLWFGPGPFRRSSRTA